MHRDMQQTSGKKHEDRSRTGKGNPWRLGVRNEMQDEERKCEIDRAAVDR
jgi:hypothetical protein